MKRINGPWALFLIAGIIAVGLVYIIYLQSAFSDLTPVINHYVVGIHLIGMLGWIVSGIIAQDYNKMYDRKSDE